MLVTNIPFLFYIIFCSLYLLNTNPFREIKMSFYISYFTNLLLTAIVYDSYHGKVWLSANILTFMISFPVVSSVCPVLKYSVRLLVI